MATDPTGFDSQAVNAQPAERSRATDAPANDLRAPQTGPLARWTSRATGRHLHIDRGSAPPRPAPIEPAESVAKRTATETPAEIESLASFVFENGGSYDSYLATEPGRLYFWSHERNGVVSYVRRGRNVLVGGGLIASADHKEELLKQFVEYAASNKLYIGFINTTDDDLPLFRKFGFQVTKWGEEGIVDLGSCTWKGKAFEWVRRQTNFCLRHGLTAFEVRPEELEPAQWSRTLAEVREVAAESLSLKPQPNGMRFFEGRIDDHELGLRRLFIARSGNGLGRIEGFVVCNPIENGTRWSTEIYRHRTDSVRGTVAFLFHHLMQQLQSEGVKQINLCLDPGRACSTPMPGDSWLIRYGWPLGEKYLSVLFDFAGLRHFKGRFRPRFENRYVCALPYVSIGVFWTFLMVLGSFRINVRQLVRVCVERIRKRAMRKTMAGDEGSDEG